MKPIRVPGAVEWSHYFLRGCVTEGDSVVDATAGNGYDTLFLAKLVGEHGEVHAFDVQSAALDSTSERLQEAGVLSRCTLYHRGHEEMSEVLPMGAYAAMIFNLGYLPGGDRSRITRSQTTLEALRQAEELLAPGGVLVVVTYPGHEGGWEEASAVAAHISELESPQWNVQHIRRANLSHARPPECWAAVRRPA